MNFITALITVSIASIVLFLVYINNGTKYSARKGNRGLESFDNEELRRMLMKEGEIELTRKFKIDISKWTVITPRTSKIIGKGDSSTIEIYPDLYGSIQLFEQFENIELINVNIEIKSPDGSGIAHISSGIVEEIINSKINGFHVIVNDILYIHVMNETGYLISKSIYNSILNDVGIIFDEMKIFIHFGFDNKTFSLISSFVENDNRIVYNGIYLKGNIMEIENELQAIEAGLLFGSIINVDLSYVVFDLKELNILLRMSSKMSLLVYKSNNNLSLNNVILIIRKTFSLREGAIAKFDLDISCLVYETYKKLTINHCLINIHFGEIIIKYYRTKDKDIYSRRQFVFTGITGRNYGINVIANYLQIKYYFESDIITKRRDACEYFPPFKVTKCKVIMFIAFLSINNMAGSFALNNCYFYSDKSENAKINLAFIAFDSNSVYSENSYFISNGIVSDDGIYTLITGDIENLYPSMRLIGYSKSGSIIYDPVIPYFDYNLNEINYEIFEKLKPNYDNFNEWNEETTTLQSTITIALSNIDIATKDSIPTTQLKVENLNNSNINNKNKNNHKPFNTFIIVILIVSVVIIGWILVMKLCNYKRNHHYNRKTVEVTLFHRFHMNDEIDECRECFIKSRNIII